MSLNKNLNALGKAQVRNVLRSSINIDKDGNESVVTISYKIKFIDSARFMVSSSILLIISQKKFMKLNVNIVIVFLNMNVSRTI